MIRQTLIITIVLVKQSTTSLQDYLHILRNFMYLICLEFNEGFANNTLRGQESSIQVSNDYSMPELVTRLVKSLCYTSELTPHVLLCNRVYHNICWHFS